MTDTDFFYPDAQAHEFLMFCVEEAANERRARGNDYIVDKRSEEPAPTPGRPSARQVFGKNVRKARRLQDVSQKDVGERAGLSRKFLSDLERGLPNFSIHHMETLGEPLGITVAELCDQQLFATLAGER